MLYKTTTLLFLIFILLINIYWINNSQSNISQYTISTTKRDTIWTTIKPDSIILIESKAKQVNLTDNRTQYQLDTIHYGDTITISFHQPENYFNFKLNFKPDTFALDSITHFTYESKQCNDWLYFTIGTITGLITNLILQ